MTGRAPGGGPACGSSRRGVALGSGWLPGRAEGSLQRTAKLLQLMLFILTHHLHFQRSACSREAWHGTSAKETGRTERSTQL